MFLVATATCKDVDERNLLVEHLRLIGVRPTINGLEVTTQYEIVEGSWPMYAVNMMDLIMSTFETIEKHNINFSSR